MCKREIDIDKVKEKKDISNEEEEGGGVKEVKTKLLLLSHKKYVQSVSQIRNSLTCLKLSCDSRFQLAFTACSCLFKEITLV